MPKHKHLSHTPETREYNKFTWLAVVLYPLVGITILHSEGHTDFLNIHRLHCTQTSSTDTHITFTAHKLPQHTHHLYCTQASLTYTPPLLHTGFLNIHTTFTAHRLPRHTHHLYCTQASSTYTPPLQHTGFLDIHTTFTAHRLSRHTHHLYCTQAFSTYTPPLLHTGFLNIHTTFTAHRLPRHTHHLYCTQAFSTYTPPLLHTGFLDIHTTMLYTPPVYWNPLQSVQHGHQIITKETLVWRWPLTWKIITPVTLHFSHLATVITYIHVLSPCHCYNMHTCVVTLPML